jgi:hypothetical protein
MAAFTAVATGFEPQQNMVEIIAAVNERRAAAIASGATGLPDAISEASGSFQGGTVKPTHLLIQEMLEALAPKYVNHGASVPVDTLYTLATWRAAAGIHADGFKRATEWADVAADPTFSYGLIQSHDIAGYWIWVEIVEGIKALQWTRRMATQYSGENKDVSATGATPAAAKAAADAAWAAASWASGAFFYRSCYVDVIGSADPYTCNIAAERSIVRVTLAAAAPVSCSCTFLMTNDDGGYDAFYDFEGLAENVWTEIDEQTIAAAGTTATASASNMPSPTATPAGSSGVDAGGNAGSEEAMTYGLLKWTFSRA